MPAPHIGEDPLVASELGAAVIKGMQGGADGMGALDDPTSAAACLKHFIGYPDQQISHDRTPNIIPDRQLLEYFAPPFRAAINAGAASMMAAYGSINGVPVTGSRAIMTELVRDELGFDGESSSPGTTTPLSAKEFLTHAVECATASG